LGASAAGAATFYREVAGTGKVWAIRDEEGFPTSTNGSGEQAMPFWSSRSRALAVIRRVTAYAGFQPVSLNLSSFRSACGRIRRPAR
jgi:hypothetical protein